MQLTIIDSTSKNEKVRVSDALFVTNPAEVVLAQAVRVYLSNARQGTSHTKTRSEINRTKKKWYKQKGTGNARHGARTPSLFVGGGVAFGPRNIINWSKSLTGKMKLLALKTALTMQKQQLFLTKELMSLTGKTSEAKALIAQVASVDEKVLVVLSKSNDLTLRSLRNLTNVLVMTVDRINALHVAMADKILIDFAAMKALEDRLSKIKKNNLKK